jgi:hypothetical protein
MRAYAVLLRPDVSLPLLMQFLRWYSLEEPQRIVRTALRYLGAFHRILSIPFLLKTLFSPWKNIVDAEADPRGLGTMMQSLVFNVVSRCIGAVVRLGAIVLSLALQCAVLVFAVAYLLLWVALPLLVLGLPLYLVSVLL